VDDQPPKKRRHPILRKLLAAAGAVLVLDFVRRIVRVSQLFDPARDPVADWNPDSYGIPAHDVEEVWFETPDGELLHGWYCRTARPIGSALYLHGNTGNLTTSAKDIPHLLAGGLNVLTFDYRGFGKSSGRASAGGIVRDGLAAARLHETLRPADLPSILYGFSMGGAVGAEILKQHSFDGLVFQSTFNTLREIARLAFPRLPLHLLSGSFFDTAAVLRRLSHPVLFLHGSDDEVCPAWMGQALHDLSPSEYRQMVIVEGGLHKDLFSREPERLVRVIREFVVRVPASTPTAPSASNRRTQLVNGSLRSLRRLLRRRKAAGTL
jgi:Hydrolases of the alpha/beta superfamily